MGRAISACVVITIMIWQLTTVPVWERLAGAIAHNLGTALIGVVVVPAGTFLFLVFVCSIPSKHRGR
jgi:hypothetical protein